MGTGGSAGSGTTKDEASGHVGGAGRAGNASADNAFGEVGLDPTDAIYHRPMAPAPTATAGSCDTVSLTGTLDAAPIDQLYARFALEVGQISNGTGVEWSLAASFGNGGYTAVIGTPSDSSNLESLAIGTPVPMQSGAVALPMDFDRGKSYTCVTRESSIERATNHWILRFAGIGFLSECESGTPVDGSIEFCTGSACPQDLFGDIDGKTYDSKVTHLQATGQALEVSTEGLDFRTTFMATSATTATLEYSWLIDRGSGSVYCGGSSSYAEASVVVEAAGTRSYDRQYHFRDLRYVGNCNQASGNDNLEIRVCMMQ